MLNYISQYKNKSFYIVTGLAFLVWMAFFDSNNLINQYGLSDKLEDLKSQKSYYQQQIKDIKEDMRELGSDPDALEKFAREKYLFKKKGEHIYLIDESALVD